MKNTLKLLSLVTILILAGSACAWAEESKTAGDSGDSWDRLLKDKPQTDEQSWELNPPDLPPPGAMPNQPPMPGEPPMPPDNTGPEPGMGMGPGMGNGPGRGDGPGMGGRGRSRGDGPAGLGQHRFGYINADELRDFLQKYEPELAAKMQQLRNKDARQFTRKVEMLKRLYGPAMRQMAVDPESGQLSLKKIRVQLKIEQTMVDIKKTTDPDELKQAKQTLHEQIDQVFDIIVAQRKQHLSNWQDRIKEWDTSPAGNGKGKGGDGKRNGKGRGIGPHARHQQNLKELQRDIETWQKNKRTLVNDRVQELLTNTRPFPWDQF
jgi:hypothetical protein